MASADLTTTDYAVLSVLSLRPYTTYELAKQMERSLHWFWPRAESKLYEEPKRLLARGLASAEVTWTGRRRSTRYAITPAGVGALEGWLKALPIGGNRLESEWVLRVFTGQHAAVDDLLTVASGLLSEVAAMQAQGRAIAEQAIAGQSPFPHRLHLIALVHRFLWEYSEAMRRWAEFVRDEVNRWNDTAPSPAKTERGLSSLAASTGVSRTSGAA